MISIIIPVHNQADKIGASLESILSQTFTDWELIIVNDGSDDNITSVVESYRERFDASRFFFYSKANEGANPTRNYGFERSHGDYVIFCDADVIMQSTMLAEMLRSLNEHPEASFAYSSFMYGKKLFRLFPYDEARLRTMPFIHCSSLIRREDFPGFDPNMKRLQDWDLWLTMQEQGKKGTWIDKPLFMTQLGGGHFSQWLPKITYKILPFLPAVKKYNTAVAAIKTKHGLN